MPFPGSPSDTIKVAVVRMKPEFAVADDTLRQALSIIGSLPAFIELPDPEDDNDILCRDLLGPDGASVGELRQGIDTLSASIAEEQRTIRALTSLLDLLDWLGAEDDAPVSAALARANGRPA